MQPTIEAIRQTVCRHYSISENDLVSKTRRQPVATARQVAMYLARICTDQPLETIGRHFNRATHGAVIHAVKRIRQDLDLMTTATNLAKLAGVTHGN